MTIKQTTGALIIFSMFAAIFVLGVVVIGWVGTVSVFLCAIGFVGLMSFGAYLLTGESK